LPGSACDKLAKRNLVKNLIANLYRWVLLTVFVFLGLMLPVSGSTDNHPLDERIASVDKTDLVDIEVLFRKLVFEDDFGYTLFGEKPISLAGYFTEQPVGNILLGHSGRFPVGSLWKTWSKYQQSFVGQNFLLLNEPDSSCEEIRVITFINKKYFVAKVNEHLDLFREELGDDVTSEGLLERISAGKETFFEILHDNEVLYGILLGYGKDNALAFERRYELMKALLPHCLSGSHDYTLHIPKKLANFSSLQDELSYWEASIDGFAWPSKWALVRPPGFVALKDTAETLELQKKYRETQRNLTALYSEGDFLNTTLRQLSSLE